MSKSAGRLDRRISIEENTTGQSSSGQVTHSWAEITDGAMWANVKQLSGTERFTSDTLLAQADTVFTIRYRSDITNKMRIVYNASNYNIFRVEEVGRNELLRIYARAHGTLTV